MQVELDDAASEFGRTASRALEAAGGDALVQRAEADPTGRTTEADAVLVDLGAWDLDVRSGPAELEAAAALCRSAGYWALPVPVAERLARPADLPTDGLVVVGERRPRAAVAWTELRWVAVDLDGRRSVASPRSDPPSPRAAGWVVDLDLDPIDTAGDVAGGSDLALGLVLPCWTLLGMLDRAIDLTTTYVGDRKQFGQPLSSFQGVQFQLTDAEVERAGLEQLARYSLWSIEADRPEAVDDALALRLAAIEAADVVFRVAHQLHGAIGFCDETALSWISRHSQPLRRLPLGSAATTDHLVRRVGRRGLTGLFDEAAAT
jgi:Acyl-CoA dehydrogenase, C-terminal domain